MSVDASLEAPPEGPWSDDEVVARVCRGEVRLFEVLMRRHNQRLFRAARAILGDDAEAEDVMQDAYVRAYSHLRQFEGRAAFATWLARIAVNEALARRRRRTRFVGLDGEAALVAGPGRTPEEGAADRELAALLEGAIDALPASYRVVFVLRELEGLDTRETAESLGIPEATVKTRLHRARTLLRERLQVEVRSEAAGAAFAFAGARCDRMVAAVLGRIASAAGRH